MENIFLVTQKQKIGLALSFSRFSRRIDTRIREAINIELQFGDRTDDTHSGTDRGDGRIA
jgi:hypothetical protein